MMGKKKTKQMNNKIIDWIICKVKKKKTKKLYRVGNKILQRMVESSMYLSQLWKGRSTVILLS